MKNIALLKFILLLTVAAITASCGSPQEESKVKVSIGAVTGSANFPGGLVVLGRSSTGQKFSKVIGPTDIDEIIVPNGTWSFAAIGWTAVGGILQASPVETVKCDTIAGVQLNGGDFNLVMNTSTAKCAHQIFGGELDVDGNFKPIRVNTCIDIKKYINELGSIPEGTLCDDSSEIVTGSARGYKVVFGSLTVDGNFTPGLTSSCQGDPITTGQIGAVDDISIPYGSTFFHAPILIETYTDTSCTTGKKVYAFNTNLSENALGQSASVTPNGTDDVLDAYLHEDACVGSQLTDTNPIGSSPLFMICNATQFTNIANDLTADYIINHDLDFSGIVNSGTPYVTGTFKGNLRGNNYTLSGGDSPLFNIIDNSGANDIRIHSFNISNFDVYQTVGGQSYGILANSIVDLGTNDIEIHDINIDAQSLIDFNSGAATNVQVGGLVGSVDFSSSAGERFYIRNVTSFAPVTSVYAANVNNATGGLVGEMLGISNANVTIEYSSVGYDTEDPSSFGSDRVAISGEQNVGGIVGILDSAEVRENVYSVVSISDVTKSGGGIAGLALDDSRISNTRSDMIINRTGLIESIGGVAGTAAALAGTNLYIEGSVSKLTAPGTTGNINFLGGIIGEVRSDSANDIRISHVRSEMNTLANGSKHGGIIGATDTNAGNTFIDSSVVYGIIGQNSASSGNIYRGGIAGDAGHLEARRIIVDDLDITGYSNLAGGYGATTVGTYNSKIEEAFIDVNIVSTFSLSSATYVGGVVGYNRSTSAAASFQAIRVNADVDYEAIAGPNCGSPHMCGKVVGRNDNANLVFNFISATGSAINSSDGAVGSYANYGFGNITATTHFNNTLTNSSAHCTILRDTLTQPFDEVTDCRMLFEIKWEALGYDSTNSHYLAGSIVEPFPISTAAQWNTISDDSLLVSKSYSLKNDIDFSGGFTQVGGTDDAGDNKFSGAIIPNGYKLTGITETINGTDAAGLFTFVDSGARIGMYGDPLVIDDLDLTCARSICGPLGVVEDANIYLNITNSIIDANGFNDVGGLIGSINYASSSARIEHSGFQGSIINGGARIGGLVGSLTTAATTSTLEIKNSAARLTKLDGTSALGGIVGSVQVGGLELKNSYVTIDLAQQTTPFDFTGGGATEVGGIIGDALVPIDLENIVVDASVANLDTNFVGFADTSGAGTFNSGNLFIIDAGAGYTAGLTGGGTYTAVTDYAALFDDGSFNYEDSDRSRGFVKDSAGKLKLGWEVNGYDDF